jgi:hypothetical protein
MHIIGQNMEHTDQDSHSEDSNGGQCQLGISTRSSSINSNPEEQVDVEASPGLSDRFTVLNFGKISSADNSCNNSPLVMAPRCVSLPCSPNITSSMIGNMNMNSNMNIYSNMSRNVSSGSINSTGSTSSGNIRFIAMDDSIAIRIEQERKRARGSIYSQRARNKMRVAATAARLQQEINELQGEISTLDSQIHHFSVPAGPAVGPVVGLAVGGGVMPPVASSAGNNPASFGSFASSSSGSISCSGSTSSGSLLAGPSPAATIAAAAAAAAPPPGSPLMCSFRTLPVPVSVPAAAPVPAAASAPAAAPAAITVPPPFTGLPLTTI